jgi:CheY-like chemotaxis protein
LLADDNEYNRIVVGETLHMKAEMLVDEAADGAAAVEMASRKRYDLILMDLVMPGLDGYEAFKTNPPASFSEQPRACRRPDSKRRTK